MSLNAVKAVHAAASSLVAPVAAIGASVVLALASFDAQQFISLVGVPAAVLFALLWLSYRVFQALHPEVRAWLSANASLAATVQSEFAQLRQVVESNTRAIRALRRDLNLKKSRGIGGSDNEQP